MNTNELWQKLKDHIRTAFTPKEDPTRVIRSTRYVKPVKRFQLHKYDKTRTIRLKAPPHAADAPDPSPDVTAAICKQDN